MPTRAKVYITCVVTCGLVLLAACLMTGWRSQDATRYAAYLALAAIASTWKVKLPGMQGTMSVNFLFVLIGVAEFSLTETVVLGCVATLVQCAWKSRRKAKPVQLAFNMSAMALSVFLAYSVLYLLGDKPYQPAFLALAATVFFVANTGSVSLVI